MWVEGGGGGGQALWSCCYYICQMLCVFVCSQLNKHTVLSLLSLHQENWLLIVFCHGSWHILVVCNCFLHYSVEAILHVNTYFHICHSVERILIWTHIINILYMFMKTEFLCFLFCTSWNLCPCFLHSASCVASQCLQQCNVCVLVWCALAFTLSQKIIFIQSVLWPQKETKFI